MILGLDIGGANLKAAAADRRAASLPFPLWKQPERLADTLAELLARFPDADQLAVSMTGELCDCFETKQEGVCAILEAVRIASGTRPIRVWSTDGHFLSAEEAKRNHMKAAAANWHALATYAGRHLPYGRAILLDIGSTTTDIIPIVDGKPVALGNTDAERLVSRELVYTGVRRTPAMAILTPGADCELHVAAEFFATALDAYLATGMIPEDETNRDTADGRPATRKFAHARLARMLGGDGATISPERTSALAKLCVSLQVNQIGSALAVVRERLQRMPAASSQRSDDVSVVVSGSGEFLARKVAASAVPSLVATVISLADELGSELSTCAPAYAVAVLASER
jgi:probable H4MPT-linked C1 transfer pathway protein